MRLGIVVVCLAACAGSAPAPAPTSAARVSLTVDQIVERIHQTYAGARTYADRGTSTSTYSTGGTPEVKTFTTAYARPDRFRFEYRIADQTHVIWTANGEALRLWSAQPTIVAADHELAMPLSAAAGVSSGLSAMIPTLLLPDVGSFLDRIKPLALRDDATVAGRPCWVLAGGANGIAVTLFVDRESYLIRRVAQRMRVEGEEPFDVDQMIDIEPRLDTALAEAELSGPDITGKTVQRREAPKWIGVMLEADSNQIREVLPASPAARAGAQPGDAVVTFDGTPITSISDLVTTVNARKSGDVVDMVLDRTGTRVTVPVTIEVRPNLEKLQENRLLDKPAPPFALATLAGGAIKLADLKGKVLVLDFWATWCKPCIASMPALKAWHAAHGRKGLTIIGITDDELDSVKATVAEHKLPYAIALDSKRDAWRDYLVQGLPTTIIVDRAGIVRYVSIGSGEEAEIEAIIKKLLK